MRQMKLPVEQAASILGGQVAGCPRTGVVVAGVSTDSRTTRPGDLFIALKGERFDGHDFVADAAAAGAVAAVVERPVAAGIPQIVVPDTLVALGKIAAWWRGQVPATVLAVTGSAGKTTTKSMLAEILSRCGPTLCTPGTQNNEIGVPLTLLRLGDERFCVVEMGARGLGHIAYLAAIARPTVGVITNIGQAHLGLFVSLDKVAQAKGELLDALPPDGTAVLNAADEFFQALAARAPCRVVSFGFDEGDFRADDLRPTPDGMCFRLLSPAGEAPVRLRVPGRHNVANALAAAAAAHSVGATVEEIVAGLQAFSGEPMRCQLLRLADGTLVINDAYNASPTSVTSALELLATYPGPKVFVFGDMLELGDHAEEAHRQVGRQAAALGLRALVAVGQLAAAAAEEAAASGVDVFTVATADQAAPVVLDVVRPGDVVLVKASRLVGLERVVEALLEARGRG